MTEFEATIAVRVTADSWETAREKLSRLIKLSYRFKYMTEINEEETS